ncbi:MAG: outer membrane lipoprotein carrier protein LolA [Rickettsiales bacterium]|jgi:outer membrane lipoprotein-sorting protein|nr:outer membrane lipoprotein carrier protein LolA [Rickettsiales bacterium]
MFDVKKILVIVAALAANPVFAGVDSRLVERAENYLGDITGLEGGFVQRTEGGGAGDRGKFYMLRPGKLRLDYDKTPIQLISDGSNMFFFDKSLDQLTTIPTSSTPASILTRKNIDLTGADIKVVGTEKSKNGFSLTMILKDNPGLGEMRVVFLDNPVMLEGWELTDATGSRTIVELKDLKTRANFPKGFFNVQRNKTPGASGGDSWYE